MNKVLLTYDCYLLGNLARKNTFCNEPGEEIGPLAGFKESVWEFKERPVCYIRGNLPSLPRAISNIFSDELVSKLHTGRARVLWIILQTIFKITFLEKVLIKTAFFIFVVRSDL